MVELMDRIFNLFSQHLVNDFPLVHENEWIVVLMWCVYKYLFFHINKMFLLVLAVNALLVSVGVKLPELWKQDDER